MRKLAVTAALSALIVPTHLHAQPVIQIPSRAEAPKPDRPKGEGHRRHLFISPSGEPFRGPNSFSAWFAKADADHDGAISAAEFQADAERVFKLYDANGDGVIDGFEIQAYEREVVPEISEFAIGGPMPGDGGGRRHGRRGRGPQDLDAGASDGASGGVQAAGATGASRFSLLNEPEPLLAADLNVDGKVSRAEWLQATARRFERLDKTHAGKLTLDVLQPPKDRKVAEQ